MPRTDDFDEQGRPVDYNTPKGMTRRGHSKSSYRRRGRDGRMHTVIAHTQRYWHGGKNFGARPIIKDIEQPSEGWKPRSARRRYYETSTLKQRQMDNVQKAEHKREPVFGLDKDGNVMKDPNDPTNIAIHPDEWWLWVSQPNQYDVARVDDPLPRGWTVERGKVNPLKQDQTVIIKIRDSEGNLVGSINNQIRGSQVDTKKIRKSTAREVGLMAFEWTTISPKMVEVPVYGNWVGSPDLRVEEKFKKKGASTYVIREAIDFADSINAKANITAMPDPEETYNWEEWQILAAKAGMRDMYLSFGLNTDVTKEEIFDDPEKTVHMWRDRYETLEPNILFGREVEPTKDKATTSQRLPDTAHYTDSKRKSPESRLIQKERGVIRRR